MFHTVPAAEAFDINELFALGPEHGPEYTITGVRCGSCTDLGRQIFNPSVIVRHASVDHVRYCYEVQAELEAEAKADRDAEYRTERYFEDRGYEEARFQEAMEARYVCAF